MYYDLYSNKQSEDYLPRLYTKPSVSPIFTEEQFMQTRNEKLLKRIVNALNFIRSYFKEIIGRKLERELKIPDIVRIITGKIPVRVMGGIAGVKIIKPIAAVPVNRVPIIFCDDDMEKLADDELIFWILPHELLHLNGIENEEFIERFLIKMYEDLGFEEISEKIKRKSAYLNGQV
ncbi:MAG: hypothetical protein QMD36_04680 [Candidatus Aenigmarchaeota archaeon]|nr:hypothetical protein [Candidatus Aenigmarchaeota archaeon]